MPAVGKPPKGKTVILLFDCEGLSSIEFRIWQSSNSVVAWVLDFSPFYVKRRMLPIESGFWSLISNTP